MQNSYAAHLSAGLHGTVPGREDFVLCNEASHVMIRSVSSKENMKIVARRKTNFYRSAIILLPLKAIKNKK